MAEVHIPKPDYSAIRRSIHPTPDRGLDPRLRRILCIKDDSSDSDSPKLLPPVTLKLENPAPRVDPRRKKDAALPTAPLVNPLVKSTNLDIELIVQVSDWYKDLSSQQKIMVNQQIAFLVGEVKKYHQDPSPDKIFDVSIVLSNQFLQQILQKVNVLLNMDGQFEEMPIQENWGPGGLVPPHMGGNNYPDFMQPPPNVNPMMGGFPPNNMRPGLLGVAPNMPYNIPPGAPPGNPNFYDYNNSYRQQNSGPPMNYDGDFNPNNNFNQMFDGDFNGGGNYNHHDGRNNRNNNFRGGRGGGGGGPDRWRSGGPRAGNNSGGGQRGGQSRRNNNRFDKIRDNRKEKSNKN